MRWILAFALLCGIAAGGEIEVRKGEKTSADQYAEYVFDGMEINDFIDVYSFHGKVVNSSDSILESVRVQVTIRDADGALLGRKALFCKPDVIRPGEVGFVTFEFQFKNKKPAILEWSFIRAEAQ
jgi:hypothetical protein